MPHFLVQTRTISLCFAALLALTGCFEPKRELRTIGTVLDDNLITPAIYHELGYEAFRERYLGQQVTITGFSANGGYTGAYNKEQLQCAASFWTYDESVEKELKVDIFANHWPHHVLEHRYRRHDYFDRNQLPYGSEIALPADICDDFCQWDPDTGACFYRSPDFTITGKVFHIWGVEEGQFVGIGLKVSGVRY